MAFDVNCRIGVVKLDRGDEWGGAGGGGGGLPVSFSFYYFLSFLLLSVSWVVCVL